LRGSGRKPAGLDERSAIAWLIGSSVSVRNPRVFRERHAFSCAALF